MVAYKDLNSGYWQFLFLSCSKRSFTLVSEEGLFEDPVLGYGKSFSYTFDEAGDYTFNLEEAPGSELVLTVE